DDPLHLAVDRQRLVGLRHEQLEQELGADRERPAGLDEGAAPRDVLRVVGGERVERLVLDLELDGRGRVDAPLVGLGLVLHGRTPLYHRQAPVRRTDPAIKAAVRAMARSRRAIAWTTLVTTFGLTLTQIPLVGELGYEHAFVVGVLMSI